MKKPTDCTTGNTSGHINTRNIDRQKDRQTDREASRQTYRESNGQENGQASTTTKGATEPATASVLRKQVFLKMTQSSQESTCVRVFFFNKVTVLSFQFFSKIDSGAVAVL